MSYYIVYSYVPSWGHNMLLQSILKEYTLNWNKLETVNPLYAGKTLDQGINGSLSGNRKVSFVNVVPIGDCHVEMFTISPN